MRAGKVGRTSLTKCLPVRILGEVREALKRFVPGSYELPMRKLWTEPIGR